MYAANADLPVNRNSTEVECPVRLDITGKALLVRREARERIVSGPTGGHVYERAEIFDIIPNARIGRRQPGSRKRRIVRAAEPRTEQLIVKRHIGNWSAVHVRRAGKAAWVPAVAATVDAAGVPIDVTNAPLELRQVCNAGLIFEVETALPVLALRLLPFLEKTTESIIVRIGR